MGNSNEEIGVSSKLDAAYISQKIENKHLLNVEKVCVAMGVPRVCPRGTPFL
jgi:hypothetical protein